MIAFNQPHLTGEETKYFVEACNQKQLSGDGTFTNKCHRWLEKATGSYKALLTPSCTAALEIAAILAELKPGDEVIMPSFTFVSTANAFVLRGAIPVFVDIRHDTLNIDEERIEAAITPLTRAIVVVHYAGIGCDMDFIMSLADRYNLMVIEDAAHAIMSRYKGKSLGSIGHLGAYSFHETKNITNGEGGALLVNDPSLIRRAQIVREKGTNRADFESGLLDRYSWVDIGSSYLPGEVSAAFLWAQLKYAEQITCQRFKIWERYHASFELIETMGIVRRPIVSEDCIHNSHIYYLLLANKKVRDMFIKRMSKVGVTCSFHYWPLHMSAFGKKVCRNGGSLDVTEDIYQRLVRFPVWLGIEKKLDHIISHAKMFLSDA